MDLLDETEASASLYHKLAAALAYAVASTFIMFVNKIVLTGYGFPSFLGIAAVQYIASIIVLLVQRQTGTIRPFPLFSRTAIRDVAPVAFIFLCNTVSGLGATKRLNMPMFVLLRRFSIVMTMGLEIYLLQKRFLRPVQGAVLLMVLGAVVAASSDLTFDVQGVVLIVVNDFATALQGVVLRKKMEQLGGTLLGSSGIMYYNNILSLPFIIILIAFRPGELAALRAFPHWGRPDFLLALLSSALMGFVLNVAYYWCTRANSPTTTTVIGAFKNILTSYAGMLFRDYHYSHVGFLGINISVAGSLWYNWEELKKIRKMEADRAARDRDANMEANIQPVKASHVADVGDAPPTSRTVPVNVAGASVSHRHFVKTPQPANIPITPLVDVTKKFPAQVVSSSTNTLNNNANNSVALSEAVDKHSAREIISKRYSVSTTDESSIPFPSSQPTFKATPSFRAMPLPPPPVLAFNASNASAVRGEIREGASSVLLLNGMLNPLPISHKKTNSQTSYYLSSPTAPQPPV